MRESGGRRVKRSINIDMNTVRFCTPEQMKKFEKQVWSGSNPMANVGDVKKVKGENGNYMVKTLENGYSITKEGETASMDLIYNKEANTWNVVANGESAELIKMNNDGTADLFLPNGEKMNVTLDAQGMMAARQATMSNLMFAAR